MHCCSIWSVFMEIRVINVTLSESSKIPVYSDYWFVLSLILLSGTLCHIRGVSLGILILNAAAKLVHHLDNSYTLVLFLNIQCCFIMLCVCDACYGSINILSLKQDISYSCFFSCFFSCERTWMKTTFLPRYDDQNISPTSFRQSLLVS